MLLRSCFIAGSLFAAPLGVDAQTPSPVSEVVVTASRVPMAAANSPYAISTLSVAELAGHSSVADALSHVASIYVQSPGGRSGSSSIFLRGADPNFTVVLFDGVPLNNSTNSRGGAVNASEIGAANLERVEIVTGPLSSLYGSGSLAGVINLVAPGGSDRTQLETTLGLGGKGFKSAAGLLRGQIGGGLGGSLGLNVEDDGEQTPGASFKARTLTGKLTPLGQVDAGRLILKLSETDAHTFPDASGGPMLASRRGTDLRKGREQLLGLSLPAYRGDSASVDLSASILNRRDDTVSPGVARSSIDPVGIPAGDDISRFRRAAAQAIWRFDAGAWTIASGAEGQHEVGSSRGKLDFGVFRAPNNFDLNRSTLSGFVEANHSTENLTFNTGLRLDDVQGLSPRLTARAGAHYAAPDSGIAVRAAVASGFKAPSFYALGNPFVGNRNLKPEESVSGEVGMSWSRDIDDVVSVTAFYTRFKGLIDFVPGPPPRLENRNLVISKGISVAATHALTSRVFSSIQAQYAQTRDDASGAQLLNRPKWRYNAAVTWRPIDALSVTARHAYVGVRNDYATPVGVQEMGAYHNLSIEAAWTFAADTVARLVIDNALDDAHEDALGFPSPGASVRVFLAHKF